MPGTFRSVVVNKGDMSTKAAQTPTDWVVRFLSIFALLLPVLAIAIAAGLLSSTPKLDRRRLKPIVMINLGDFYNNRKDSLPDRIRKIIGEDSSGARFLDRDTPWEQPLPGPDQSTAVYNVLTGEVVVGGVNPKGLFFPRDATWIKEQYGLGIANRKKRDERVPTDDEVLRHMLFISIRGELLERAGLQDKTHSDASLIDLSNAVDEEIETPENRDQFWASFRLTSQLISFFVVENTGSVRAKNISIFFDNSRTHGLRPHYIAGLKNSEFGYSKKSNRVIVSVIWPKDKLIIATKAIDPIEYSDVRLSWDERAVIDKGRIVVCALILALFSFSLTVMDYMYKRRVRTSAGRDHTNPS